MIGQIPLLIIAGPTASGKSSLAIKIAKYFNTDIVSCDSAQVYRYMDIGTAKPTLAERAEIKHHLIDYVYPDEEYSAVRYKSDCDKVINTLSQQNKVPILCGGTGMYYNSVLFDMNFGKAYKSEEIRKELTELCKINGNEYIYNILKGIDRLTAEKLHPNDTNRIIRAIEIYRVSGLKKSELEQDYKKAKRYNYLFVVLNSERNIIYEKINNRTDIMIKNGLIDEVDQLIKMGYKDCKSLQAIGYKEILDYFNGKISLTDATDKIKQHTRNYAKRQITWFKSVTDAVWYNTELGEDYIAQSIIEKYNNLIIN